MTNRGRKCESYKIDNSLIMRTSSLCEAYVGQPSIDPAAFLDLRSSPPGQREAGQVILYACQTAIRGFSTPSRWRPTETKHAAKAPAV